MQTNFEKLDVYRLAEGLGDQVRKLIPPSELDPPGAALEELLPKLNAMIRALNDPGSGHEQEVPYLETDDFGSF